MRREVTPQQGKWLELMEQVEGAQRQVVQDAAAGSSVVMERLEQGAQWSGILGSEAMKLQSLILANKRGSDEIKKNVTVQVVKQQVNRGRLLGRSAFGSRDLGQLRALSAYWRNFEHPIWGEPLRTPEVLATTPEDIGIDGMGAAAMTLSYIFEIETIPQPAGPWTPSCRMNIYLVMQDRISHQRSSEEKVYRVKVYEPYGSAPRALVESAEATAYLAALEKDFHAKHDKKAYFDPRTVELPDEFYVEPTGLVLKACQELEGRTWEPHNIFAD